MLFKITTSFVIKLIYSVIAMIDLQKIQNPEAHITKEFSNTHPALLMQEFAKCLFIPIHLIGYGLIKLSFNGKAPSTV